MLGLSNLNKMDTNICREKMPEGAANKPKAYGATGPEFGPSFFLITFSFGHEVAGSK